MKWFGFHSLIIHNPVIPHGHILFILSIQVFNGSGVIGSFWQFYFLGSGYSSVHICQMNWKKMQITSYDTAGRRRMLSFEQMIQRDEYSTYDSHRNTTEFGLF